MVVGLLYHHHPLLLVDCRHYCKDAPFSEAAVVPCRPSRIANCEPTRRSTDEISSCRVVHDDEIRRADIRSVFSTRPWDRYSYRRDDDDEASCFGSSVGYFRRMPTMVAMPLSRRRQLPPLGTNRYYGHSISLLPSAPNRNASSTTTPSDARTYIDHNAGR